MSNQLAININVQGAAAAQAALQGVAQSAQQAAAAINALGGNMGGAAAAASSAGGAVGTLTNTVQQHAAAVSDASTVWLHLGGAIGGLPGPLGSLSHAFAAVTVEVNQSAVAMLAMGGALTGILSDAVHATLDFQQQMGILRATLPVADVQQFGNALTALAQKLGQETVFSSTQAIEAMGGLARAGLSTEDILGGVAKSTLDMAAAMGTDPKNAALALGAALREFNLTAADAPKVADLFSQAVHVAGLSADGLRTALGQAGPVIRAMGGNLQDAVTGIELLTRSGISAGKAGTQLAQLYEDVVNPRTKEAAAMMQQLGFITADGGNKFVDAAGKVRPFVEVARILSEGLAVLTPQQEALATQTEFSRRAMLDAMVIANQYATGGIGALVEAQNNARTAAQAMQERLDNLWGSIKQLSSSIQTLAVDIGSALAPAIKPVVDSLKDMVNGFIALGPEAMTAAAAIAGVEAAMLTLGGTAAIVGAGLGALGITIGAIAPPLLAVAAATAAFVVAWQTDFMGIQEGAAALGTQLHEMWLDIASAAIDAWNALLPVRDGLQAWLAGDLPTGIQGALAAWQAFANEIGPTFRLAWEVIQPGLSAFTGWLGENIPKAIETMRGALASGLEALINFVSPIADAVGGALHEFNTRLQEGLASMRAPIVATAQNTGEQARNAFINGIVPVAAETAAVATGVSTAMGTAANGINLVTGASGHAKTALEEHRKALQDMIGSTDAATVSQGLYEQHLESFIEKTARSLPAIEGQALALINAGRGMEALALEAQQLGLSEDTLIQASQGVVAAQNPVKAALEAVTGSHEKAKTAAKTHAEALKELVQSSDASLVAIGLEDQAYDKFATATLPKLTPAIQAQVMALRNAGDSMGAAAAAGNAFGATMDEVSRIVHGQRDAVAAWAAAMKGEAIPTMGEWAKAMFAGTERMNSARDAAIDYGLGIDGADKVLQRATAIQKEWAAQLKEDIDAGRVAKGTVLELRDAYAQAANEIAIAAAKAQTAAGGFRQVGGYITDGIRTGMGDFSAKELFERVNGLMRQGVNDMKSQWGIQSPSSVMAVEVGRPLAEGIALGVDQGMPAVTSAMRSGLDQVVSEAGDYARRAASAFDTNFVMPGAFPGGPASAGGPWGAAGMQAYQTLASQNSQYLPFSSFGMGPEGRAVDVAKQAQAFQDAQKQYWESTYGTTDPAKAQAAYLQSLQLQGYQLPADWLSGKTGGSTGSSSTNAPALFNPLLGYSANVAVGTNAGTGGGRGTSGGSLGTSGSGEASVPIYATVSGGLIDPGNPTRQTNDSMAAMNAAIAISNTHMQTLAKNLANSVPLVMQSWSSISDYSKQAANSMAGIPGAFSAFAIDLNSKMASSISGAWTVPTIGGPSGPQEGPGANPAGIPSGSTQGGANFAALQALAAQVVAEHPDLSADSQARLIQQGMRTNQDYLKVVGNLTDTSDDLRRQQEDAANQVQNWTNVVRQQGDAYASGSGALQALQDAQANLTNVTNALAANVSATTISAPPPTPQAPTTPVPTTSQIANLQPGQFYTLNSAGELVVSTAQNLSGGPTGPTTAPLPPAPTVTAPTVTTPTVTTPTTPTTPTVAGPVKIGTTATGLDVYQMPDGSTVSVPTGSPAPTTTTAAKLAQGAQAGINVPAYVPGAAGPDVSTALGSLGAPLIPQMAAGGIVNRPTVALVGERGPEAVVPLGRGGSVVNLTANITLNNAASTPQLAAQLVRQIREEFRRQGTDVMRIGGI